MRIDVTQMLYSLDGKQILQGVDADVMPKKGESAGAYRERATVDISFRKIAVEALLEQESGGGEKQLKKFILAERIQLKDMVVFSNADITMLKEALETRGAPLTFGRMIAILDPEEYKRMMVDDEDETEEEEAAAHERVTD